jgi:hypothetical protein
LADQGVIAGIARELNPALTPWRYGAVNIPFQSKADMANRSTAAG